LILVYACCRSSIRKYLKDIIKQDCLLFDRTSTSLEEYFNTKITGNEDINTSRGLKDSKCVQRRFTNEPFKFKENLKGLENVEETEGEHNLEKVIEIKVANNNYVGKVDNVEQGVSQTFEKNKDKDKDKDDSRIDFYNLLKATIDENADSGITIRDYESLNLQEQLKYDKRIFSRYLKDNLVRHNQVISIICKVSIVDPTYIRITKLIFAFSLIFGTNALLFTDSHIEQIGENGSKVIVL
jgi:hypothetical protein